MEQLPIPADLSEASVEGAASILRYVRPHISVSRLWQVEAKRLADMKGWSWSVDSELSGDEWKLKINGQTIYSPSA